MIISNESIVIIALGYMFFLFACAYITEQGLLTRFVCHPIAYILSLGVFASSWAIHGSISFAYYHGYNFLAYFLGISGIFFFAPIFLMPLLRLVKTYQLNSIADLFTFRYRSPFAGTLVTIVILTGTLPLLAIQIQAIAESIHILSQSSAPKHRLAFLFVIGMAVFTILFGARHINIRERHEGLVTAMALGALVKIICFSAVGIFCLLGIFNGFNGLQQWLTVHPEALNLLYNPINQGPWRSLFLPFFVAAIVMPHMYHMTFTENLNSRALLVSTWGFPLYMLLFAVMVPLILWGALKIGVAGNPEYFTIGIGLTKGSKVLTLLAFIAGLSAASGTIIVATLALSIMVLNHLILPTYLWFPSKHKKNTNKNIYHWLLQARRVLILCILLASYLLYSWLAQNQTLAHLGLLAFVATLQFTPGLLGVVFWPQATCKGFIAGLFTGFFIWLVGMFLPSLASIQGLELGNFDLMYQPTLENWRISALFATTVNGIVFTLVSLLTKPGVAEQNAAKTCAIHHLHRHYRWELSAHSVNDFIQQLSNFLGAATAKREIELAVSDLGFSLNETRPYALRRLRDQLETNLSSLLGPAMAQEIVEGSLPYKNIKKNKLPEDIHLIENRLETYHHQLTGLAAELDHLRRFHRQILQDLPIGVCSLGEDYEILSWNKAMEDFTQINHTEIIGSYIGSLPQPWQKTLSMLVEHNKPIQKTMKFNHQSYWIRLNKTTLDSDMAPHKQQELIIVVENLTEVKRLEAELAHTERLAAIGELAAGVAHEIGNPITGIACLAQEIISDSHEPDSKQMAQQIIQQTQRVTKIVQSLVSFSHAGESSSHEFIPVGIKSCLQEAIDLILLTPNAKGLKFINICSNKHNVLGNYQRLLQVFLNLLSNARDACKTNDIIQIHSTDLGEYIQITVSDQGKGISKDIIGRIFEPFVTTKDPGEGTGLGLSLVYRIIKDHEGKIQIENKNELDPQKTGTIVTIKLPKANL